MTLLATEDLYGRVAPYAPGCTVWKSGAGYCGPGKVMCCFLGDDWHWRVVVAHQIAGGQGQFFHIYGWGQLRPNPADEPQHGDLDPPGT